MTRIGDFVFTNQHSVSVEISLRLRTLFALSLKQSFPLKNMHNQPASPEEVVQRQLDAYNTRDIAAFTVVWAEDAQYFDHPSTRLANGSAEIRERHVLRFKEPNLYGSLVKRMVVGNMVVDQERVA